MRARGVARVNDEDERLAQPLHDIDRGAGGAQIVRRGPRRDEDEIGLADHFDDGRLDRGRRVDDQKLDAELAHALDVGGEARRLVRANSGVFACRTFHQSDRLPCGSVSTSATGPAPAPVGGDGEMAGERRFAGPAFLRCDRDDMHGNAPRFPGISTPKAATWTKLLEGICRSNANA